MASGPLASPAQLCRFLRAQEIFEQIEQWEKKMLDGSEVIVTLDAQARSLPYLGIVFAEGCEVVSVLAGSCAAAAGVRAGDSVLN